MNEKIRKILNWLIRLFKTRIDTVTLINGNGRYYTIQLPKLAIITSFGKRLDKTLVKDIKKCTKLKFRQAPHTHEAQPKTFKQFVKFFIYFDGFYTYYNNYDTKNTILLDNITLHYIIFKKTSGTL